MKFIDEYRDAAAARTLAEEIRRITSRPWTIMEVCGGQTHSIVKFGVDQLLPPEITLVHGPGCPVCVTPLEILDAACEIASRPDVVFCSFGDMLRVPGSSTDLLRVKARGGDVRIVYSPMDAVAIARAHPQQQVVFFAVGFETTAPANAMAVYAAAQEQLENFSILVSQVTVPAAMIAILDSPHNRVQGFLAAGHVCSVMGYQEYEPLASRFRVPIVVTGFEPVDLLEGILMCVKQLEARTCGVENQYARAVTRSGNSPAQKIVAEVFEVSDRNWRGIGVIPGSGLALRQSYRQFDAENRFAVQVRPAVESPECISGLVLQGIKKPNECPSFGTNCTPDRPLGATMVSGEGACAAYYRYRSRARATERKDVRL